MGSAVYYNFAEHLLDGSYDLSADTIKLALLSPSYVQDLENHTTYNDIVSNEISGTGYNAGGVSLTNQSWARSGGYYYFSAQSMSFTGATFSARYAVLYDDTHATDDLICCLDFGETKTGDGNSFLITFDSLGIMKLSIGSSTYYSAIEEIGKGSYDFSSDALYLLLVGSGYTFDQSHTTISDITNELAASGGYSTGGAQLQEVSVSRSGTTAAINTANIGWADLTPSTAIAGAVLYHYSTGELLSYHDVSGVAPGGNSLSLIVPSNKILTTVASTV